MVIIYIDFVELEYITLRANFMIIGLMIRSVETDF